MEETSRNGFGMGSSNTLTTPKEGLKYSLRTNRRWNRHVPALSDHDCSASILTQTVGDLAQSPKKERPLPKISRQRRYCGSAREISLHINVFAIWDWALIQRQHKGISGVILLPFISSRSCYCQVSRGRCFPRAPASHRVRRALRRGSARCLVYGARRAKHLPWCWNKSSILLTLFSSSKEPWEIVHCWESNEGLSRNETCREGLQVFSLCLVLVSQPDVLISLVLCQQLSQNFFIKDNVFLVPKTKRMQPEFIDSCLSAVSCDDRSICFSQCCCHFRKSTHPRFIKCAFAPTSPCTMCWPSRGHWENQFSDAALSFHDKCSPWCC